MVTKRETKIRYETAMRDCGRRYRVCRGRVELPMEPEGRVWHEPSPSIEVLSPDRREAARHTVTSRGTACASALMRQEIWDPLPHAVPSAAARLCGFTTLPGAQAQRVLGLLGSVSREPKAWPRGMTQATGKRRGYGEDSVY